jgi:hypothetical protein
MKVEFRVVTRVQDLNHDLSRVSAPAGSILQLLKKSVCAGIVGNGSPRVSDFLFALLKRALDAGFGGRLHALAQTWAFRHLNALAELYRS